MTRSHDDHGRGRASSRCSWRQYAGRWCSHIRVGSWRATLNVFLVGTSVNNVGPSAPAVEQLLQGKRSSGEQSMSVTRDLAIVLTECRAAKRFRSREAVDRGELSATGRLQLVEVDRFPEDNGENADLRGVGENFFVVMVENLVKVCIELNWRSAVT